MERLNEPREELVEARAEAARLAEEMEVLRQELVEVRTTATEETQRLAERYRTALLQAAPDVPAGLVQGASVEELDRSLVAAREVVARVREHVQAEAVARIPAGSPVRGTPNTDSLSPAEKIRLGVAEKQ